MNTNKNEPALLQQDAALGTDHTESISETKAVVNPDAGTWLADMRREKNLAAKDVVAVIRTRHEGFDAALYSKIERPDKYGITLIHGTAKAVKEWFEFKTARKPRTASQRTYPCRVQFRLSESEHAGLQTAIIANGYATTQAWGREMALHYISEHGR